MVYVYTHSYIENMNAVYRNTTFDRTDILDFLKQFSRNINQTGSTGAKCVKLLQKFLEFCTESKEIPKEIAATRYVSIHSITKMNFGL